MRPFSSGIAAVVSVLALTIAPACNGDKSATDTASKPADPKPGDEGAVAASGVPAGEAGDAKPVEAEPEVEGAEAGAAEAGAAEAGAAEPVPEPAEDPLPGLIAQAKSLDTDDAAAKQALTDAMAAGMTKIDAAKLANERGEALMAEGEGERAAVFFEWASTTHTLFSEPVYNLATLAAYAGDLEIAKEHLAELAKRGNKKLMKKVGVDPAFALLHDDADVRKIYEQ